MKSVKSMPRYIKIELIYVNFEKIYKKKEHYSLHIYQNNNIIIVVIAIISFVAIYDGSFT